MYNPEKAEKNVKGILARLEREYGRKYNVTTEETDRRWKVKAYGTTVARIYLRDEYQCKRHYQTRDITVKFPASGMYRFREETRAFRSDSPRFYERLVEEIESEHSRELSRKAAVEQKSFNQRVYARMLELMPQGAPFQVDDERMLLKRGSETVGRFEVRFSEKLEFEINRNRYKVDYASELFMYLAEWVECARLAFDVAIHELRPS